METEEQLAVNARTEDGRRYLWSTPDGLREAVRGLGPAGNRFLVVQRVRDLPREFAQVWHEEDGDYRLEHRRGADEFAGTNLDDPDRVARLLAGWARRDDGWDAGIAWEPVPLPPTAPAPALPADVAARAENLVRALLRDGYLGIDGLVRETVELMADEGPDDTAPLSAAQARELVERLWVARVAEQRAWTGPTDPERLSRAFTALEREGVVAREDFTCCRSCGTAEIGAEAEDAGGARGFVFFHRQSTRSAAEGHGLSLHYGGFDGSAETTAAVGREVTAALTAAGLSAVWDGDPAKAIELTSLTWHKRLVG
ncbi:MULTISPECIES: DUF6891 domain-containing protein [unclassified Streptomyces]|uniref:DUF6891 domain-containing protein n=1 Tax=unclassified Streptomyces TaxID=2593676 RepID=UPI0037F2740B